MTDFRERAEARRARITLSKGKLGENEPRDVIRGTEAVLLVHQLTLTAWAWSGKPVQRLGRHELPYRFVPERSK
jgi:hypothetical protein